MVPAVQNTVCQLSRVCSFPRIPLITRGAIVPMPPPETVLDKPKSVPEKLGARSTWLAMWPADRAPLHHIPSTRRIATVVGLHPEYTMVTIARAGPVWEIVLNIRREDLRPSLFDLTNQSAPRQ